MHLPPPNYDYLLGLIDDTGIYEHSRYGVPRREHGYTLDDASRGLIVLCDGPGEEPAVAASRVLLAFTLDSVGNDGRFRNRLTFDRRWLEESEVGDVQGRATWALAVAATRAHWLELRDAAASALSEVPTLESSHIRPLAYAALAAHALWADDPETPEASRHVMPFVQRMRKAAHPWPEARLGYDNGRIPAAVLAAGAVLGDEGLVERGLETLEWLVDVETRGDDLSFTPVGGREPGGTKPAFDQQPLEAAALSDACERAWLLTHDRRWRQTILRCGAWLQGSNDRGVRLYNPDTGATMDGLMEDGVNANSGAESTISGLAVLQTCQRVEVGQHSTTARAETESSR